MKNNYLIVLEGSDHAGKSTIAKMLKDYFDTNNGEDSCKTTFQPGDNDGEYNQVIKDMCKTKKYSIDPLTNLFAFLLDRSENTLKVKKWLDEDKTVVVDRWWHSTIAYQFYGKELLKRFKLNLRFALWMNRLASHNLVPDYAFYLSRPKEKITDEDDKVDLFETETDLFKKRVDKAYKKMVKKRMLIPIVVDDDPKVTMHKIVRYIRFEEIKE